MHLNTQHDPTCYGRVRLDSTKLSTLAKAARRLVCCVARSWAVAKSSVFQRSEGP